MTDCLSPRRLRAFATDSRVAKTIEYRILPGSNPLLPVNVVKYRRTEEMLLRFRVVVSNCQAGE